MGRNCYRTTVPNAPQRNAPLFREELHFPLSDIHMPLLVASAVSVRVRRSILSALIGSGETWAASA